MKHSPEGASENGRKEKAVTHLRNGIGGVLALFTLGEALKVGTDSVDLRASYEATLEQANRDFREHQASCGGESSVCMSYEMFLNDQGVPDPDTMKALEQLIREFKYPVRVYSGTTLAQRLFIFAGRHSSVGGIYGTGLSVHINGHEIFLTGDADNVHGHRRLTTTDVFTILAELSHAYQTESGRSPLFDIRSGMHIFTEEGYRGAYADTDTAEYEAHTVIERLLAQRLLDISSNMRSYYAMEIDLYARSYAQTTLTSLRGESERDAYRSYTQLLERIEVDINQDNSTYTVETILKLLERLPGFSAHMEQRADKTLYIHLEANDAHFRSLRAFIEPYTPTGQTITETVPMIEEGDARDLVRTYQEYRIARDQFESQARDLPFFVAVVIGGLEPNQEFTYELYERVMRDLQANYDVLTRSPLFEADHMTQQKMLLLQFVNNISTYDPSCTGVFGVLPPAENSRGGMFRPPELRMGQSHYEAMRRFFDRARHPELYPEPYGNPPTPYGR